MARGRAASSCSAARPARPASAGSTVGDEQLERPPRGRRSRPAPLPAMPPIEGLDAKPPRGPTARRRPPSEVPGRLLILGGGVVGVELAQAWSSARRERHAGRGARSAARRARSRSPASRSLTALAERASTSAPACTRRRSVAARPAGQRSCSRTARRCAATSCSSRSAGDRGPSEHRARDGRASSPAATSRSTTACASAAHDWLYAIGDVNGRALLTHMGKYQARIAADHDPRATTRDASCRQGSARRASSSPTRRSPPSATPSPPPSEAGLDARAVDVETSGNAGASFHGRNAPGTTRLVVDEDRGVIVGATFVGPEIARLPARGDDRDRRRGPARTALARGAGVPDPQRDLAQAARAVRGLSFRPGASADPPGQLRRP